MRERECGPDCTETLLEVEAYLDGEVDPDLATRITDHLSGCSPCLDRAEFRKHLKEIVATPRLTRVVRHAAEGHRGAHLLLRQTRFAIDAIPPDLVSRALADADGLRAAQASPRPAAPY